jgi:hypothetical protein
MLQIQFRNPLLEPTTGCLSFLLFVTLFGFFLAILLSFAFACSASFASYALFFPVRTYPDTIYNCFFPCFLVSRVFVAISNLFVLATSAAVYIDVSVLLYNCSIISCSGLSGLYDPLCSNSKTTAV